MVSPQSNNSSRSSSRCPIRLDDIYLIFYRLLGKLPPLVQTQQKNFDVVGGWSRFYISYSTLTHFFTTECYLVIQSPITQSPEKLWGTACLYSSSFDCNSLFIVTREDADREISPQEPHWLSGQIQGSHGEPHKDGE